MKKRSTEPLTQPDLEQFLSRTSDFAFEMATLSELRKLDFVCEHAATYTDPVTEKIRAYDVRARRITGQRQVRLAVECKNIGPQSPLVVHATPRLAAEAYHTLLVRHRSSSSGFDFQNARRREESVYPEGEPVGRHTDQPAKDSNNEFVSADSATYEKWLQAVNGSLDLLREASRAPLTGVQVHAIIPMLVVPPGSLWQVDYSEDGRVMEAVRPVDRTTLILRHVWTVSATLAEVRFDFSHLEIVTLAALASRVSDLVGPVGLFQDTDGLTKNP